MQPVTWFLVGDASRAFLLQGFNHNTPILVKEFDHPAGREHGRDLVTDAEGRSHNSAGVGGGMTYSPRHNPKENEQAHFVKELADFLADGSSRQSYQELVLVAPPQFLGSLRDALDPQVTKKIKASLDKDLTSLSLTEITARLKEV